MHILKKSRMYYMDASKQAVVNRYNSLFDEHEAGSEVDYGELFAELIEAYVKAEKQHIKQS